MIRIARPVVLNALLIAMLIWAFDGSAKMTGDFMQHFLLVDEILKHGGVRPGMPANLAPMAAYPPGAHWLAALLGHVLHSGLLGMAVLTTLASYAVYWLICQLIDIDLTANAIAFALAFAALAWLRSFVGWEMATNGAYPQLIADPIFFAVLVWLCRRPTGWLEVGLVALAGTAAMSIHPLVALHALGAGNLLLIALLLQESLAKRRLARERAGQAAILIVASLAIIACHPAFRAMVAISVNDGQLDFRYPHVLPVILICGILGAANLRGATASDRTDLVLGAAGVSSAILPALQEFALLLGVGSFYSVKKHMFLTFTLGVINLARLIARGRTSAANRNGLGWLLAPIFACIATVSIETRGRSPLAPLTEALDYANAARPKLPQIVPGEAAADVAGLSLLENILISQSAFEMPAASPALIRIASGAKPDQVVAFVLVRSSDLPASCKTRLAPSAAFSIATDCASRNPSQPASRPTSR